jgi:2-(1,2-epoxy-1,2-dihydrophenyl)acetyl-CoA isomerase
VCTVRGWAVGLGCNLALAADFTVAADDALFWEPFVTRGFSPDSGSTWLLPRLVGLARAKRMLLLGDKVAAKDAEEWGLIHRAVNPSVVDDVTEELLARLGAAPTVAIGLAKQAIHYGQHATLPQTMNQELFNLELSCRTIDSKRVWPRFATSVHQSSVADDQQRNHSCLLALSTTSATRSTDTRPRSH